MQQNAWSKQSWRGCPILQQPQYPDAQVLESVRRELAKRPTLVARRDIFALRQGLAKVSEGEAFLLQGGDCAESFSEYSESNLQSYFRLMLQMAITLVYGASKPVIKVGRIAGQFAKPRSAGSELRDGLELPSYRGDMVNGIDFDPLERAPDPRRLLRAYSQSASTLNYLNVMVREGFSSLENVGRWNAEFVEREGRHGRYREVVERIHEYIRFVEACGMSATTTEALRRSDFYTSHEALLLDYEEALTRYDEFGHAYVGSAHMLWIGNRTRQVDGAHVEFLRGVDNPVGIKLGPGMDPKELAELLEILNPSDVPGRIVLISRMGYEKAESALPSLVEAVKRSGRSVTWSCDPMHGNTKKSASGFKTRAFDDILGEVRVFFDVHRRLKTHPGGVHFEMTGQAVTECVGGSDDVRDENLNLRYHTHCDPRLNANQSLELAFLIAEELRATT